MGTIRKFHASISGSWILIGDFNAIWFMDERLGKQPPSLQGLEDFNNLIADSQILEMAYKGPWFAWENHQLGNDLVLSKIDRAFCIDQLLKSSANAWVEIKSNLVSNHKIIIVHLDLVRTARFSHFRHINAWSSLPGYKDVVASNWDIVVDGPPMFRVMKKLKEVRCNWNKKSVGNFHDNVQNLLIKAELSQRLFDADPMNIEIQTTLKTERKALDDAYALEESLLRQKSRSCWLKLGDRNSKFFYASLKTRRNRNTINCLYDDNGRIVDYAGLKDHITSFYKSLFNQPKDSRLLIPSELAFPMLSADDVRDLCKLVTPLEIEYVVLEADLDRAPGSDGFNGHFYKDNWQLIKMIL